MKIKTVSSTYKSVMAMKKEERKKPLRPNPVFRTLLCVLSWPTLKKTHFGLEKIGMEYQDIYYCDFENLEWYLGN